MSTKSIRSKSQTHPMPPVPKPFLSENSALPYGSNTTSGNKKLRDILSEWAEETDAHGPKYIRDAPSHCSRNLWIAAVVVSIGCMCAQFYSMLDVYIEEKTVTKVYYETVGLETERMMQVVYCPAAWLNFTKAEESGIEWPVL